MKCVICKQAETVPGQATLTLERDGPTLVVKQCRRKSARTAARNTSTKVWLSGF
jgi:hypothetical protein